MPGYKKVCFFWYFQAVSKLNQLLQNVTFDQ